TSSSWPAVCASSRVAAIAWSPPNRSRIFASSQPSAFSSTVTLCLRLRSIRTPTLSRLSISNSRQAPRLGSHLLALDLARVVVDDPRRHEHRGGVRHVLVLALLGGVLGRLEPMIAERE